MFTGGFKESTQEDISIEADPAGFGDFLKFLYTGIERGEEGEVDNEREE